MKNNFAYNFRLTRWSGLDDVLNPFRISNHQFVYRGQSNQSWGLTSSLSRILRKNPSIDIEEALALEKEAREAFMQYRGSELADHGDLSNPLRLWPLMRHFGAPTRVLDWSTDPYIAAYFAVSEGPDVDGAIWYMDRTKVEEITKIF